MTASDFAVVMKPSIREIDGLQRKFATEIGYADLNRLCRSKSVMPI